MSNLLTAVSLITDLTQAAARLTATAASISAVVSKAQMEGRDLTYAEWADIKDSDDKAKADLDAAIAAKRSV